MSDIRGGGHDGKDIGVASQNYFKPGGTLSSIPSSVDERVPELLTIVKREEIDELFELFFLHSEFDRCHTLTGTVSPHVPVLYKAFHTPDLVLQRSQFLCTV